MIRNLGMRSAMAACALAGAVVWSTAAEAATDSWAKGAQWMSLRAGYATQLGDATGQGGAGYGFGYSRMLNKRWALGLYAHHEVLSKSGAASQMVFPFTAELVRHYKWRTELHPYLGLGGGGFNARTTRSGEDHIRPRTGYYVVLGANTPIDPHQVLGLDLRVVRFEGETRPVNVVFDSPRDLALHPGATQLHTGPTWSNLSLKLNWSYTY